MMAERIGTEPAAVRGRMRDAVHRVNKTVTGFCEEKGITQSIFYNKSKYPSTYAVMLICTECNVSADWILFGKE